MPSASLKLYRFSYSCHQFVWKMWPLALIAALVAGVASSILMQAHNYVPWPLPHGPFPGKPVTLWLLALLVWVAIAWLLVFLVGLGASAWFSVRFRCVAWWLARAFGKVRTWLLSGWRGALLLLTAVTLVVWAYARLIGSPLPTSEALTVGFALKVAAATVLLALFYQAYRARKRIVILPFSDFTGEVKLKAEIDGLAARLLNELASLTELYGSVGEARPATAKTGEPIHATVSVEDIGQALRGAVSADSKVKLGPLELPIGAILGLVMGILQGPRISGSLHREGSKLLLTAKIEGGGLAGSWRVSTDDIEEPGAAGELGILPQMSKQMAYRVFTHLAHVGSPRWRAVRCYFDGLRIYRETLRTEKDRRLNLRRAEKKFIEALSEDNRFPYGHYTLGLVYRDLDEYRDLDRAESSRAAFVRAVKQDPSLSTAYYALALSHWKEKEHLDAIRFCESVLALQPEDARAWNLKGLSERKLKEKQLGHVFTTGKSPKAWKDSVQSRELGAALAWRALCRAALAGRAIEGPKEIACSCLRSAAVAHAMLRQTRCRAIFRQALCLAPADPELHFELGKVLLDRCDEKAAQNAAKAAKRGKVYVDRCDYRKGIEALTRAVHIEERPLFWAYLAGAYARQFRSTRQDQYKSSALDACQRAMEVPSGTDDETQEEVRKAYRMLGEEVLADRVAHVKPVLDDEAVPPGLLENWEWAEARRAIRLAYDCLKSKPPKAPEAYKRMTEAIKKLEADHHHGEIRQEGLHACLAEACRLQDQWEEALGEAERAVALSPDLAWVWGELGSVYFALQDWERAEAHWKTCLDLNPNDPAMLQNIALAYWNKGVDMRCPEQRQQAFARVIDLLGRALEISEKFETRAWAHYWLGRFHCELKHYDQGIYHLKITQAAGFKPLECKVALGSVYTELGAYDEAEQSLREATSKACRLSRGIERSRRATAPAEATGEETPLNELLVDAYQCWAFSYAERGVNLERASHLLQYAARHIARIPPDRQAEATKFWCKQHDCLGWIHVRAGKTQEGIAELEKALALGVNGVSGGGSVPYHLACAYLARAQAEAGDAARWLAKVRECCENARATDLRGRYGHLIADLLIQADALSRPKTEQPGAVVQKPGA